MRKIDLSLFLVMVLAPVAVGQDPADEDVRVYTNADLPPAIESGTARVTDGSMTVTESAGKIVTFGDFRDRDGHGEGWWRYRAATLEAEIYRARLKAEQLHVEYVKGKQITDPTLPGRSRDATAALKRVEAEYATLGEQLRRAGGLPGWLRRGGYSEPTTLLPPPAASGATFDGAALSWAPVANAAFYLVELQCDDCCGLQPCDALTLDTARPSAAIPYAPPGSGRWRVRSLDIAGFAGDWSDWHGYGGDRSDF